jgi:hypothetical protein
MGLRQVVLLAGVACGACTSTAWAAEAVALPALTAATAPASESRPPSRFRIDGQKFAGPQFARSEAGVGWSVDDRLSLELHYERGAYAPMMHQDHDDGIMTRLKIRF